MVITEGKKECKRQRSPFSSSPSRNGSRDSPLFSTLAEPACSSSASLVFTLLPVEGREKQNACHVNASFSGSAALCSTQSTAEENASSPPVVHFGEEGVRIGRDPGVCDVTLPSWNGVSRLHCVISVIGSHVQIRDLSLNGTFVNGRLVGHGKTVSLTEGDMISVCNPYLPHAASFAYLFSSTPPFQKGCVSSLTTSPTLSSLSLLLPHYSLGVVVGQGVYCAIYAATDKRTGDTVAIKVLKKQHFSMDIFESSIRLEAEVLHSLHHPHIIRLIDTVSVPGLVALVMELAPGGDLFDYVASRGKCPFTEEEARFLFHQITDAVSYIHKRNILHCDLKPENVVIAASPHHSSSHHRSVPSVVESPVRQDNKEIRPRMEVKDQGHASSSALQQKVKEVLPETPALRSSALCRPPPLSCVPFSAVAPVVCDAVQALPAPSLSCTAASSPFQWQLKLIDFGVSQYFHHSVPPLPFQSMGYASSEAPCGKNQEEENKARPPAKGKTRTLRMAIPTIGTPAYAAPELHWLSRSGRLRPISSAASFSPSPSSSDPNESFLCPTSSPAKQKNCSPCTEEETAAWSDEFILSPALDMWSLGVLLYILCSGSRPKKRSNMEDPLVFHQHMEYLSASCKAVLRGLLTVDPRKRMTMKELRCHPWWKAGGIRFTSPDVEEKSEELYFSSGTSSPTSPRYAMNFSNVQGFKDQI